ncbi:WD repeat-containing protein 49-like, partial [Scleropages formosus]
MQEPVPALRAETMETEKDGGLLENRLSVKDFEKMQSLFLPAGSGEPVSLTRAEFAERALAAVGRGSREEYGRLFDSADVWREGRLDWARLASFLLLELREKEARSRATAVPRWGPLRGLPSLHRDTIQQVAALRSSSRYLSVSKEGTLGVWSDELILLKSHRVSTDSVKPRDLWVTAMAVLHNVHKVAVSFTSKEICFFDLLSKQELSCQYKVQGLRHAAVSAICFRTAQISLFEKAGAGAGPDAVVVIKWAELVQGQHGCCYALGHRAHDGDWVRRVKFLGNLEAFVSCTTGGENSMAVAWREQEATPLRVTAARIEGGASDLDYHVGLNLIGTSPRHRRILPSVSEGPTAGLDGRVLLWNPYVVSKPVGVLQGHATGVLAVHFLSGRKQLVSFSKDQDSGGPLMTTRPPQVLRVWDVHHQLCVQRVAAIFPKSRECRTLLLFHEERGRLFLTFNALLTVLEAGKEAERRVTSHAHAVTCVLYNSFLKQVKTLTPPRRTPSRPSEKSTLARRLFWKQASAHHVISSDAGSTVTYWLVDTGQKVKQFTRCHGNAEISAMALDDTQTRLFTGGTDGLVKVWDFNGHCHHKLDAGQTRAVDILQILVLKRMVLVLGWSRTLTVFWPSSFAQCSAPSSEWTGGSTHRDHILCAAFLPPQTLVTDSELLSRRTQRTPVLRSASQLSAAPAGAEDQGQSCAVTRLLFLEGRKRAVAAGGADLVSCGGSGLVRFWNTKQGCLLAQFVAHRGSASITMTADEGGRYLVTGDMDGEVKVWDVQNYCVCPGQAAIDHAPNLLSCSRPHNDCVTHLETCSRGGRLLLLSASADCRVALGLPTGAPVGTFGQEQRWCLEAILENPQPSGTLEEEQERALPLPLHGNGFSETGPQGEAPVPVQQSSSDPTTTVHPSGTPDSAAAGDDLTQKRDLKGRYEPAAVLVPAPFLPFLSFEDVKRLNFRVVAGIVFLFGCDAACLYPWGFFAAPWCVSPSVGEHHGAEVQRDEEVGGQTSVDQEPPLVCTSLSMSCTLGRSYQERRGLGMNDIRLPRGGERHGSLGMFSSLRIEDLASVGEFTKPDFMINPHLYFGDRWDCPPHLSPALPTTVETVKAAFDERSLFPRNILQLEERQGRLDHKREAQVKKNVGRRVASVANCTRLYSAQRHPAVGSTPRLAMEARLTLGGVRPNRVAAKQGGE